jgi:hypothetical protein
MERIEIHEETKVCIDEEMADQCSVSNKMLLTIETVNSRIADVSAMHKEEISQLEDIIQLSGAQLQDNMHKVGASTRLL